MVSTFEKTILVKGEDDPFLLLFPLLLVFCIELNSGQEKGENKLI